MTFRIALISTLLLASANTWADGQSLPIEYRVIRGDGIVLSSATANEKTELGNFLFHKDNKCSTVGFNYLIQEVRKSDRVTVNSWRSRVREMGRSGKIVITEEAPAYKPSAGQMVAPHTFKLTLESDTSRPGEASDVATTELGTATINPFTCSESSIQMSGMFYITPMDAETSLEKWVRDHSSYTVRRQNLGKTLDSLSMD